MEYLALYRKYRPKKFSEIAGQNMIVETIQNAIINNKITHAYLFCGPRGTGKTTTAKLIAKMVNCLNPINGEPCGKCESCISIANNCNDDIIEIDAASNNGVDEIREIRDKINLVPSISKYKVYIIDEVHMLSIGAFNALLKTLEEPPRHVIFILATTEEQKIPATILSRCQKFNFSRISVENIVENLKRIINLEGINIDEELLKQIAIFSDGGMRDSINMLDQLISSKGEVVTIDDVYEINGSISFSDICNLFTNMYHHNVLEIVNFIDTCDIKGKNMLRIVDELIAVAKDLLISIVAPNLPVENYKNEKLKELKNFVNEDFLYMFIDSANQLSFNIKNTSYPKIMIQVFLIKMSSKLNIDLKDEDLGNKNISQNSENETREIKLFPKVKYNTNYFPGNNFVANNDTNALNVERSNSLSDDIKKIRINNTFATANKEELAAVKAKWSNIADYVLNDDLGVIAGVLQDSTPVAAGSNNIIIVGNNISVTDRLNQCTDDVSSLLKKVLNKNYLVIGLNENEWLVEKNNFVKNKKSNIQYKYIDELQVDDSINSSDELVQKNVNNDINDLINIVGSDIIEYK